MSSIKLSPAAVGLVLFVLAGSVASQQADAVTAGRPEAAFAGCETVIAKTRAYSSPRERKEEAPTRVDAFSGREFASLSADQLRGSLGGDEIESCWFRLDGVWREDTMVALDTNFVPDGWAGTRPELVHLAHGTYATPMHIYVRPSPDRKDELRVNRVDHAGEPAIYSSKDGVTLERLLQERGLRKVYTASRSTPIDGLAQQMTIDVTQTGYLRLRIGATTFLRPAPGTVAKVSGSDPFMIGYTMENLRASRAGYDVTSQNPDRLFQNSMAEVFDFATDRGAVIDQRRVIPLGLTLIKEETQGTVFYTTSVSSERDFQRMSKSSFGNSTRIGVSAEAGTRAKDGGGPAASVSGDVGGGWGGDNAKSQFSALKTSGSVAEETGYMRFKKLALVVDPPYARLTDRFIDAVADARRHGDFNELIRKFGTHYPHAITYGAAGRLSQRISAKAMQKHRETTSSSSSNENVSFLVGNTSAYRASQNQTGASIKESNEFGERIFDAVGGNGSWDQNGFSAGDAHYPILADLRPLSDLLNPINFPEQPEIYVGLRRRFALAIEQYIIAKASLSEASLIPEIVASAPPLRKRSPYDQTIAITTANNTREALQQTFTPNVVAQNLTRICVRNNTRGERMMTHDFQPRINPLRPASGGGSSCANFPARSRVTFELFAAGRKAQTDKRMSYDTKLLAGGRIDLVWQ